MFRAVALSSCVIAASILSACGNTAKPLAGTIPPTATTAGRAHVDDPRTVHVTCLRQHGFDARKSGKADIVIGSGPNAPYVHYEPTPGAAAAQQIEGLEQGAEAIGGALLYPRGASAGALKTIEDCVAKNVVG